jgi:hypothetical protein
MSVKYHKKAKLLFAKTQVDETTPATVGATDAIAIFDNDFNTQLSSDTFQYTGSELDRDEGVTITDKYAEAMGDTFVPALGVVPNATAASATYFPLEKMFLSAGGNVTYGAGTNADTTALTADDQSVRVSNDAAVAPNKAFVTLDVMLESSQDAVDANLYKLYGCRSSVDLDITLGSRARMKWNFKGNAYDSLPGHEDDYPMVVPKLVPNYGTQKEIIMDAVRQSTVRLAELQPLGTALSAPGVSGFGTNVKNINFNKISAANLFGFDYERFLSIEEEGFSREAVATDVVLTVLAPKGDAAFVPDKMLEKMYQFQFGWGLTKGKRCRIQFTKLQVMNVANSLVGSYQAKDITFRNTGTVIMTFF